MKKCVLGTSLKVISNFQEPQLRLPDDLSTRSKNIHHTLLETTVYKRREILYSTSLDVSERIGHSNSPIVTVVCVDARKSPASVTTVAAAPANGNQ